MALVTEGKTLVRHEVEVMRKFTKHEGLSDYPRRSWCEIEAGFHYFVGNDGPHFSVTASVYSSLRQKQRGDFEAGGCMHELVLKIAPELAPVVRWHLTSMNSGPMHYVANARYWAEKAHGVSRWPAQPYDPDPAEAFRSTVVFGAVETDAVETSPLTPGNLRLLEKWCEDRRRALMERFRADVEAVLPGLWAETEATCWE